ncbi:MEDS domain-containing protein [Clostridium sp. DL1XJH146]
MSFLCNKCNLSANIEKNRVKLDNLITEKNYNLLNSEVINLSKILDVLVYECVLCNKDIKNLSRLNLTNIFGTHSVFYYYGDQHLFASMYLYIIEGINNNEIIYVSMEKRLQSELLFFLKVNNVDVKHIKFRPVEELIRCNSTGGLPELKEKINNIFLENEVKKYSGVRWIGQPTYAIQTTSQKDFLDWEINLSEALKSTNLSLLCIYDAYDYMHEGEFINETVIKQSISTHSYILT